MRKGHLVLAVLMLATCLTSCGDKPDLRSVSESPSPTQASGLSTEDIAVRVIDYGSNLNEWHHFGLEVSHSTDKYLTAEIQATVYDRNGDELGGTTAFVHNLGAAPVNSAVEPFLAKIASEYQWDYKIVSYKFTDGVPQPPEITAENVQEYIRLTWDDYGDIYNHEKEIVCGLHNLTPQYFSGAVTVTVYDQDGSPLETSSEFVDNLGAYENKSIPLWFPIVDSYTVDYSISNFQFSDSPIA